MSKLAPSELRNKALEAGVTDEYPVYFRFSELKNGFDGFIERVLGDFSESGIEVNEELVLEKFLPVFRVTIETFYEGGFIHQIRPKDKVRGLPLDIVESICRIATEIIIIFLIRYGWKIFGEPLREYLISCVRRDDFKKKLRILKEEVDMSEEELKRYIIDLSYRVCENMTKRK